MQTLDDHEAVGSRPYVMVELGLHHMYILGKGCVVYAYIHMQTCICI